MNKGIAFFGNDIQPKAFLAKFKAKTGLSEQGNVKEKQNYKQKGAQQDQQNR